MRKIFTLPLLLIFLCLGQSFGQGQQAAPSCGTDDSRLSAYLQKHTQKIDLTQARVHAGEKLEYRLALDVNYNTYLLYDKDKEKITREAYRFIQEASDIFEREINVKLTVSFIYIWEQPEPYALAQDTDYFSNVLNYWSANRFEERDAVVSLSCRNGWFYGGYRMCSSNFPWPGSTSVSVDLLCHELGHTLGSPHTHSCSWPGGPIDRCNNLESVNSECQDGYLERVNGSLMSYCRSALSFHPLCRNLMRDYSEGKVLQEFKLNALNEKPASGAVLSLKEPDPRATSSTPSFEWRAPTRAGWFRLQISSDQKFTSIEEDTLVSQSYFQSPGLGEGPYYARYRAENEIAAENWSPPISFTVAPLGQNSTPPLLLSLKLNNLGEIGGSFHAFKGITSYEVEVTNRQENHISQFEISAPAIQKFKLPKIFDALASYSVRLRVQRNGVWTQWSAPGFVEPAWSNALSLYTRLDNLPTKPLLATINFTRGLHVNGFTGHMEISTDADFKTIIYKDSVTSNKIGQWYTNKMLFRPELEESKTYYVRSRVQYLPKTYSEWMSALLTTGSQDLRYEFLGLVSPNLQISHYVNTNIVRSRFAKAGHKLYVSDTFAGYYETSDLQSWTANIPSSTNGKSPVSITGFGVGEDGTTYLLDELGRLAVKSGSAYQTFTMEDAIYIDWQGSIVVSKNDGIFFNTNNKGIARFSNGNWQFYQGLFNSRGAKVLSRDPEGQVWAVLEGGRVTRFADNEWTDHGFLPNWESLGGLAFDKDKNCYAYGEWGITRFDASAKVWELIPAFSAYPVRKVIFMEDGTLWASSFRLDVPGFQYTALLSYRNGNLNAYTDGLAFFSEPFDLETFNNKLLILTNGGELHAFDEQRFQLFIPKSAYCIGDDVIVKIASNSNLGRSNKTSLILKNLANGQTTEHAVSGQEKLITIKLPLDMPAGQYTLSTNLTQPRVISHESASFAVYVPSPTELTIENPSRFQTILKSKALDGQTYQWQRNGIDIAGATKPEFIADQSGNYSVTIENAGGCVTKSAETAVALDTPTEVTLLQNSPNPVTSSTKIAFYLPAADDVEMDLFNIRGQKLGQISKGRLAQGWHFADVDGHLLSAGLYVYRLKAGSVIKSLKMSKQR